jgi:hypothetical protein
VESQFDDMKNDLALPEYAQMDRTPCADGTFVQFLALILTARIRAVMASAWESRMDILKKTGFHVTNRWRR